MMNSKIEWCDHTFNPWVGCTKISPACDHCYAEGWAKRTGGAALWQGERRRTSVQNWRQPLKWDRAAASAGVRAKVFCASLADVFDNQVPQEWRTDLWALIRSTPHLDWLLLTKRPQNIEKFVPFDWPDTGYQNVWLGTTVENQAEADRRIPHLLSVPARVRFLSCEPLLGSIEFSDVSRRSDAARMLGKPALSGIHWVIAGGESGPGARPMHPAWARSLRDQCKAASVAFFMKQMGGVRKSAMPPIPQDIMIMEVPHG
jgi:protein gp37